MPDEPRRRRRTVVESIELHAALNPAGDRKVERFGWTFAPADKVMQIENDYEKEVYNGDIGTIDDVDSNSGELIASFDGRSVSPPSSTSAAALRTASDGRHGPGVRADWSGASHSRSRTARRERHATEHQAGPPARRRPRAAACRAIERSPTKSDLVGCSFKCSPNANRWLEARSTRNRHKSDGTSEVGESRHPIPRRGAFPRWAPQLGPSARRKRPERAPWPWGELWGLK